MTRRGERIRIVYLNGLGMGGTERVVCDCATHLDADIFATSVGVLHGEDMRRQFQACAIPIHVLRDGIQSPLAAGRVLATAARRRGTARGVDIVHTHSLTILFYAALAAVPRRSWKWVHTEHCVPIIRGYYPTWLLQLEGLPCCLACRARRLFGGDRAFHGSSQLLSLLPGVFGEYLRRDFYRLSNSRPPESMSSGGP